MLKTFNLLLKMLKFEIKKDQFNIKVYNFDEKSKPLQCAADSGVKWIIESTILISRIFVDFL